MVLLLWKWSSWDVTGTAFHSTHKGGWGVARFICSIRCTIKWVPLLSSQGAASVCSPWKIQTRNKPMRTEFVPYYSFVLEPAQSAVGPGWQTDPQGYACYWARERRALFPGIMSSQAWKDQKLFQNDQSTSPAFVGFWWVHPLTNQFPFFRLDWQASSVTISLLLCMCLPPPLLLSPFPHVGCWEQTGCSLESVQTCNFLWSK